MTHKLKLLILLPILAVLLLSGGCAKWLARHRALKDIDTPAEYTGPGEDLIGRKVPNWEGLVWVQGEPVNLKELPRPGRLAVVHYFMDNGAADVNTARSLEYLHREYADRGVQVVGVFLPPASADDAVILASRTGATFPMAVDPAGAAQEEFWRKRGGDFDKSNATLLLHKRRIRHISTGPELTLPGDEPVYPGSLEEYLELQKWILYRLRK